MTLQNYDIARGIQNDTRHSSCDGRMNAAQSHVGIGAQNAGMSYDAALSLRNQGAISRAMSDAVDAMPWHTPKRRWSFRRWLAGGYLIGPSDVRHTIYLLVLWFDRMKARHGR